MDTLDLGFFEGSYEPSFESFNPEGYVEPGLSFWDDYEPLGYNPYAYVDPVDQWAVENDPFSKTGVYEDSWLDKLVSYGGSAASFGAKLYGTYKMGAKMAVGGLSSQLPRRSYPEPANYEMQSRSPAMPAGARVSVASPGQAGGGLDKNMVLIGVVLVGAALLMKGR